MRNIKRNSPCEGKAGYLVVPLCCAVCTQGFPTGSFEKLPQESIIKTYSEIKKNLMEEDAGIEDPNGGVDGVKGPRTP